MDIEVKARLNQGIKATAQIANMVEVPVAPDVYTGDYEVTPTEQPVVLLTKDKMMLDDVTIDGTEIDWDFILYPIEGDADYIFNAKTVVCEKGSTIIIEYVGCGRVLSYYGRSETYNDIYIPKLNSGKSGTDYTANKEYWDTFVTRYIMSDMEYESTNANPLVFGGGEWQRDGQHSSVANTQFRGKYMKVKIIPPSDSEYELEE